MRIVVQNYLNYFLECLIPLDISVAKFWKCFNPDLSWAENEKLLSLKLALCYQNMNNMRRSNIPALREERLLKLFPLIWWSVVLTNNDIVPFLLTLNTKEGSHTYSIVARLLFVTASGIWILHICVA